MMPTRSACVAPPWDMSCCPSRTSAAGQPSLRRHRDRASERSSVRPQFWAAHAAHLSRGQPQIPSLQHHERPPSRTASRSSGSGRRDDTSMVQRGGSPRAIRPSVSSHLRRCVDKMEVVDGEQRRPAGVGGDEVHQVGGEFHSGRFHRPARRPERRVLLHRSQRLHPQSGREVGEKADAGRGHPRPERSRRYGPPQTGVRRR